MAILLFATMLVPIPRHLKDGGTVEYTALLYRVSKVYRLKESASQTSYIEGIQIEILGKEIYSNVSDVSKAEDMPKEKLSWDEITEEGVDEALLWSQIDQKTLEEVAKTLQNVMEETVQEEKENPQLAIEEGWTRIFQKEGYRKVVEMGEKAQKPLYWIIYKSENAGLYEYLCSQALYEIMGFNMQKENGELTWANSKEFLEQFNQMILERRPKDFTVLDKEGKEIRLSEFYGKPTVLVFWASWCPPCREELPAVESAYQKYQKEVNFLLINMTNWQEETVKGAANFVAENGYHFPIYFDLESEAQKAYQIKSIPQIRFLDKTGSLYKSYQQVIEKEEIAKTIEEMLQ